MCIGELRCFDDLFTRRFWLAVRDVLPDSRMEEKIFLQYETNLASHRLKLVGAYVASINTHLSFDGIVETSDQTSDSRLACTRWTNKSRHLARLNFEGHIF